MDINFKANLHKYEKKVYSQNGEDGIISKIVSDLQIKNKKSLEFGVQNGKECNTRLLRENGWNAICFDSGHNLPSKNIHKEFIKVNNINHLIRKYDANDISLLSIDIDGNDFYVWKEIKIKPKIVIIEYNSRIPKNEDLVMPYKENYKWNGSPNYSSGALALYELGKFKGYTIIGSCSIGTNLFFIRNDNVSKLSNDIKSQAGDLSKVFFKTKEQASREGFDKATMISCKSFLR